MAKRKWSYDYPRPALTVDIVLFTVAGALNDLRLQVLLIQRNESPFRGAWALPGGFVRQDEDLSVAARRELLEETGVSEAYLEQVTTVGTPGRDPRGHVVTVVYVGLVPADRHQLRATGDAAAVRWFDVARLHEVPLAFDHARLLVLALEHLRGRLGEVPVCFQLLPEEFTLSELQTLAEAILGRTLDRRNFRRKVDELHFLRPVPGTRRQGAHRPAQLYRFVPEKFAEYAARSRTLPF
jgi:8-oxo-dGTP diphosphatase